MERYSFDDHKALFDVIKFALWQTEPAQADWETYHELKRQTIATLAAPVLADMSLPPDLMEAWEKDVIYQVCAYERYLHFQDKLPIPVPYVILKGTAAAQYYPFPVYRMMGDIDIMTSREDYAAACDSLLHNGFGEVPTVSDTAKHRSFVKAGVEVEVHQFFAAQSDIERARYIDEMIIGAINPSHVLPDLVNGYVLLEHINYHMEYGLGLRQIVDWMMFVDKCLPDEAWPDFQEILRRTGQEKLAIPVTRMCEMYLGLSQHRWCASADEQVCEALMEYVLSSGNFGRKWTTEHQASVQAMSSTRSLRGVMRHLSRNGIQNWKAAQKYPILRPVAWIYQLIHYLIKGLRRKKPFGKLMEEISETQKREKLFEALGVSREREGRVVFDQGEYQVR